MNITSRIIIFVFSLTINSVFAGTAIAWNELIANQQKILISMQGEWDDLPNHTTKTPTKRSGPMAVNDEKTTTKD